MISVCSVSSFWLDVIKILDVNLIPKLPYNFMCNKISLNKYYQTKKILVSDLLLESDEEIAIAERLASLYKNLSASEISAIAVAKVRCLTLLTNNAHITNIAVKEKIKVSNIYDLLKSLRLYRIIS